VTSVGGDHEGLPAARRERRAPSCARPVRDAPAPCPSRLARMLSLPQLTDGGILLRPHQPEDSEAMHAAVTESIPAVSPWLQWCHAGYSREETDSFIKLAGEAWAYDSHYPFAILAVADGAFLGGTGINHIVKPNRLANVGYWVRTSRTRQGIACAALRLVSQYAFDVLGLTRLEIVCLPSNTFSCRVAEKVGAGFEAIARNRIVMHGTAHNAALYGLVPEDMRGGLRQ
jgi:ribosomal-protein-serine acetyltransferase